MGCHKIFILLGSHGPAGGAAAENLAYKSDHLIPLGISTVALETGEGDEGKSEFQKATTGKVFRDKPLPSHCLLQVTQQISRGARS